MRWANDLGDETDSRPFETKCYYSPTFVHQILGDLCRIVVELLRSH